MEDVFQWIGTSAGVGIHPMVIDRYRNCFSSYYWYFYHPAAKNGLPLFHLAIHTYKNTRYQPSAAGLLGLDQFPKKKNRFWETYPYPLPAKNDIDVTAIDCTRRHR